MAASQNGVFGIRSVLIAALAMAASASAPASHDALRYYVIHHRDPDTPEDVENFADRLGL